MKKIIFTLLLSLTVLFVLAQAPSGYYSGAEGKNGEELMQALHSIIKDHTVLIYSALWSVFPVTDVNEDGTVLDMYSSCVFIFGDDQDGGSGGTTECELYNREHSFPQSWFDKKSPMVSDLFHIYPVDKKVNSVRDNYPFGQVGNATYTSTNGCELGTSSYSGYSGVVFEPTDEYKGDFARTYFYMVTRYYDVVEGFNTPMLNKTKFPAFTEWALNLLLEWHEQDPVSEKEIVRNNLIYDDYQHNRNPFIDNPNYAKDIWDYTNSSSPNLFATQKITVSPNPAQDVISVKTSLSGNTTLSIYNLLGSTLIRRENIPAHETNPINISALSNGVYLICVESTEGKAITRLVVNR